MQRQKPLVRVHGSPLAANERRMMLWVAERLPPGVKPDHMTILGLGGSCLCGAGFVASGFALEWLWLAELGLLLNWAGDSLDGNLARVRGVERPQYGFFVDHISDVVSQLLIFMGLALSTHVRFDTGCLLLMSYWLAALFTFIRAISARVFQISYYGIGPTEIRLGLAFYILSVLIVGPLPVSTWFGVMSAMDLIAIAIFVVVVGSFVVMSLMEASRLAAAEIKPGVSPRGNSPTVLPDTQAL